MKKRKKNQLGLWVMVVSVFFLLAAPLARAGDYDDGTYDVTADETYLNIGLTTPGTTVNLYANISEYILVGSGSFLNIYSGNVGMYIAVSPGGVVTVYGTDFDGYNVPDEVVFTYGSGILTGHYGNGSAVHLWFLTDTTIYLQLPPVSDDGVIIDIKPGSDENVINLNSNGVVPVAVLTTSDFDADNIDPDTVLFAGASPLRSTMEDVDNDGDMDKLFHFRTQELNLDENSTEATLTGSIKSASAATRSSAVAAGNTIQATDKVQIKSSKKK